MKTLVNRMFAGEINPGQLEIVRTIRTDTTAGDIDTAVYQGALADYAFGSTADGRLTVTDVGLNPIDGTDTLSNIERLQFTDATLGIIVGTPGNDTLNGTAGDDLMLGLAGNDTLNGLAGNDVLVGGTARTRSTAAWGTTPTSSGWPMGATRSTNPSTRRAAGRPIAS